MALVKIETFKTPAFVPGNAESNRAVITAQMNAFLAAIAPQDVLQLELHYVSDGKYSEQYAYVGHITYFVP